MKFINDVPEIDRIIGLTSQVTGIPVKDIKGQCRKKDIKNARHMAMWCCAVTDSASLVFLGYYFGKKDHTTIINARKKTRVRYQKSEVFKKQMDTLCDLVNPTLKEKLNGETNRTDTELPGMS